MEKRIRSPIVVVLGHVDVGKTTLLDKIRGTAVTLREPGTMTQHIGASFLPWKALESICGDLLKAIKAEVKIPGLLVIDTPGHEAFANLRRRGGSIADIAILVVDVLKGFEKQTYENLEILRSRRTPFLIAANKIDKIPGWSSKPDTPFIKSIVEQDENVRIRLEELLYRIIEELYKFGLRGDRYDRIKDFARTVAIVPISAKTGEGIADLLMVLAGLAQKYMLKRLSYSEGPAKGVILEVKEEVGLGTTVDVIIYDGILRKGDTIVLGGMKEPIVTRVKALLMPKPLDEMRSPEDRFLQVEEVYAASGVKVVAPYLDEAIAGAPLYACRSNSEVEEAKKLIREEVAGVKRFKEISGVIVKADTLGTLEALTEYIEGHGVPVRYADVGPVVKRDIVEASLVRKENKYYGVILAFNVKVTEEAYLEAKKNGVKIFTNNIIYRLIEEYLEWYKATKEADRRIELSKLIFPGKIKILPGYVFRRSDPAIVGIKVLSGRIKPGYPLMKANGKRVGEILQIQEHGENLQEATTGMEVAISIRGNIMIGRQVKEGEILYVDVPLEHAERLESLEEALSEEERGLLKEIREIKVKANL